MTPGSAASAPPGSGAPSTPGPAALLPPDYHTHTYRCGHAVGTPAEYVEAALAAGVGGIGICDHLPLFGRRDAELTMDLAELEGYVEEVLELRRAYPGYVLLGIEADYEPETFEDVADALGRYPFDYVIGSVHFLDGWGFDDPRNKSGWTERDVLAVYESYFDRVGEAAETGSFTILGHLDLVKKFGHRPAEPPLAAIRRLVERVAAAGPAVEVNTAGLRKPVGEPYPGAELLASLARSGVPLTFGSDAHAPVEVGLDFAAAVAHARSAGYTEYAHLEAAETPVRAQVSRRPLPPTDLPTPSGGRR